MRKTLSRSSARTVVGLLVLIAACTEPDGEDAGEVDELDVRVEIPEADPAYFDLVTPEAVIPPGEERLFCFYFDPASQDYAVRNLETLQGKYGHHAVILEIEPDEAKPSGTVEDCTDLDDMLKFRPLVIPSTPLPEGYAARIPANTHVVVQSHYINASDQPLRIRDVLRAELVDPSEVTTWSAIFTLNTVDFAVPSGEQGEVTVDCVVPQDSTMLFVGPHMHESGMRAEILVGPDVESLELLQLVDPWRPEYRDTPPVENMIDAPLQLAAGDIVRTRCVWDNQTDHELTFPEEMCGSFGYLAGTDEPWVCLEGVP